MGHFLACEASTPQNTAKNTQAFFCATLTFLQYFKNIKQDVCVIPPPVISMEGGQTTPVLSS